MDAQAGLQFFDNWLSCARVRGHELPILNQKERDIETGLDYFGARYYGSVHGRFTSPDDFWKDSQIGDPQSWNKYAYARNNPLRYIDPSGEKATVTIETDEQKKKGTIKITASIAIYTNDKNISKEASNHLDSYVPLHPLLGGADTGKWNINNLRRDAGHEFGHLMGAGDHEGVGFFIDTHPNHRASTATGYDYGWALGGAINAHRAQSRPLEMRGILPANPSGMWTRGQPRGGTSTREIRPAKFWWR